MIRLVVVFFDKNHKIDVLKNEKENNIQNNTWKTKAETKNKEKETCLFKLNDNFYVFCIETLYISLIQDKTDALWGATAGD